MVNITQYRAASCKYRAFLRVYANIIHSRQIDDEPVVANTQTCEIVAAPANRNQQFMFAAEIHCCDDVCHVRAPRDHPRSSVDHSIVNLASFIVTRVTCLNHLATHVASQGSSSFFGEHLVLQGSKSGATNGVGWRT